MIVEIRKAGFINKGAELMLHAAIQQIQQRYPDAKLVMAPSSKAGTQPFHKLVQLGFYPKAWLWRYRIQWGDFASLLSNKHREMYGLVLDKEVNVVLDAAGFSYSDQWGIGSSRELTSSTKRWKRNGTKVFLLPQAFGPFNNQKNIKFVQKWIKNVDLVFPRDLDSYNYLIGIVGEQNKIKQFPDFTNLLHGTLPSDYDATDKRVGLVPNYRMIDKTSKNESEAYLPFMIRCAKYLTEKNMKPFILVHEGENDLMLAEKISQSVGSIPIVKEIDPLHIKGIIGTCDATIGSRYHGLISALSQGVPSLATGWSHKYIRLFEDYDFSDGLVSVFDNEDDIYKKIDSIINPESSKIINKQLNIKSEELKKKSREMWKHVFKVIDS